MDPPVQNDSISSPGFVSRFFSDLWLVPGWFKGLLALAIISGVLGVTGQITSREKTTDANQVQKSPESPHSSARKRTSPWLTRIGFSVVAGYVVGWLFRAFLKVMSLAAIAFTAIMAGLSYFHILNVDMTTTANTEYKTATAWVSDQAGKLRDAAMKHVPSAPGGLFGVFVGLKKRR